MAQVEARELELEQVVPHFVLPSIKGGQVNTRDYKQKNNLLLVYLDLDRCSGCGDLLRELADNYHAYRELETEILVIGPQPLSDLQARLGSLGLPFPVLSDEHGEVGQVYLKSTPGEGPIGAIFLTDRYGALRTQMVAHNEAEFPNQATVLDWISLIEMECPECGVSEWQK